MGGEAIDALIRSIPDESAKLLTEIKEALARDDLEAAHRSAHSLKGLAGNFAADRISEAARDIEQNAVSVVAASRMVPDLDRAIARTRGWLDAHV